MDNYHLTQQGDAWELRKEGASSAVLRADTKDEALRQTREYMEDRVGSVKIHDREGRIQEERTYHRKDDPVRTKG